MVCNTENETSLQKLPDKLQISGKRNWNYCWKLREKKVKQYFSETTRVDSPEPSVQLGQAELEW